MRPGLIPKRLRLSFAHAERRNSPRTRGLSQRDLAGGDTSDEPHEPSSSNCNLWLTNCSSDTASGPSGLPGSLARCRRQNAELRTTAFHRETSGQCQTGSSVLWNRFQRGASITLQRPCQEFGTPPIDRSIAVRG